MQRIWRSVFQLIVVLTLVLPAGAESFREAERKIILGVHPYLPPPELQKRYEPLAQYLQNTLGSKVIVRVGRDYEDHMVLVGTDRIDIAFLGPAAYVRMVKKFGKKPILARIETRGNPVFNGYLVTSDGSGVTDIASLRGKRFAFGDPESTMSHLIPRHMLLTSGIDLDDLGKYAFLGSHTNVALGVLAGDYDAGAVKGEVLAAYRDQGLRAFAKSPAFSEHLFVTRSDATPAFVEAVKNALYSLSDSPEGRAILSGLKRGITGMAPAEDADYDNLREVLETLGNLRTE